MSQERQIWEWLGCIDTFLESGRAPYATGHSGGGVASPKAGLDEGVEEGAGMEVEGQPRRSPPGFHLGHWSGAGELPTQPLQATGLEPWQGSHVSPTNLDPPPGNVKWGPQRPLMNSA